MKEYTKGAWMFTCLIVGLLIGYAIGRSEPSQKTADEWLNEYTRKQLEWLSSPEYELARKRLYDNFRKVDSIIYVLDTIKLYELIEEDRP